MRKILVFILVLISNYFFFYGISYANNVMRDNNFMIYLLEQEDIGEEDEEIKTREDHSKDTEFNGETIEQIAKKMDSVFLKSELEDYGNYISKEAIHKGLNPYLVGAIILESTNCTNKCSVLLRQCFNVAEIKGKHGCFGGSYKKYDSIENSIDELINTLYKKIDSDELQNPYKMFKLYGKNEVWAYKVNDYMEKLKRGN